MLREFTHRTIPKNLAELIDDILDGRSTLGEKAALTFGIKMYFQHTTDPAYSKWAATVATPTLLEKRTGAMLKQLEIQIWSELMDGLLTANACEDYLELSSEAVAKFDNDPVFLSEYQNAEAWSLQRKKILEMQVEDGQMSPVTMGTTLSNGGFYPVSYPWMTDDLLIRDDDFLTKVQGEFRGASTNCTVMRSTIRDVHFENGVELESEFDVLGVFASRDIKEGETTLVDKTIACVLNTAARCPTCCGPMPKDEGNLSRNSCCNKSYCSQVCSDTALKEFHRVECGREDNLESYHTEACNATETTDFALEHILFQRIIANAIADNASHPLKTSFLQRLTPSYSTEHLAILNWKDHIVAPTNIVMALGIDVFKNQDYDTWVLQTIRHRLQNNKHGVIFSNPNSSPPKTIQQLAPRRKEIIGSSLSPLYSMHNHSCDPNVTWEFMNGEGYDGNADVDGRCSTIRMFANRDIKQGEEMTITYILPLNIGRGERNEKLLTWLGGECRCERCLVEKEDEESSEVVAAS